MLPQKEKRLLSLAILLVGSAVLYFSYKNLDVTEKTIEERASTQASKLDPPADPDHAVLRNAVQVQAGAIAGGEFRATDPGRIGVSADTMHLAFIVFGSSGVADAFTLIRSIAIFTRSPLKFHIFTPDKSGDVIEAKMSNWPQEYKEQVTIVQYATKCPVWQSKATNLPKAYRNTGAKICAYETLFNSDIRNTTDKAIYMDIDIIALDDLKNLWSEYNNFNQTHMMGSIRADLRYLNHGFEYTFGKYGLNGGILVMDLAKMVDVDFITEYFKTFDKKYRKNYNRDDQDMLNVYFSRHSDRMIALSCSYNVRHAMDTCGTSPHRCYEAEQEGVKFLHSCVAALFNKSAYTPIYKCMQAIDFNDLESSIKCLEAGVKSFLANRLKTCPTHTGFMTSLKASLQRLVTHYNDKHSTQLTIDL